jgi:hypothetical protein
MGLYYCAMPCYFCRQPLGTDTANLIGFDMLLIDDQRFQHLADSVVHHSCFSKWDLRDKFIACWNEALSKNVFLKNRRLFVDAQGIARYNDADE